MREMFFNSKLKDWASRTTSLALCITLLLLFISNLRNFSSGAIRSRITAHQGQSYRSLKSSSVSPSRKRHSPVPLVASKILVKGYRTIQGTDQLDQEPALLISPNGKLLAISDFVNQEHQMQLWDIHSGRRLKTLKGQSPNLFPDAFSPHSKSLLSIRSIQGRDYDFELMATHPLTGAVLNTLRPPKTVRRQDLGSSQCIGFSRNGSLLCWVRIGGMEIWNWRRRKYLSFIPTLTSQTGFIHQVAFSGNTIAGCGNMEGEGVGVVAWWDYRSGRLLRTITLKCDPQWTVKPILSSDAKYVALGEGTGIKVWDARTGKLLHTLAKTGYYTCAFTDDGKTLIATDSRRVKAWNIQRGNLIFQKAVSLSGWTREFSPDGRALVTADATGTVKLWRLK